MFKFLKFSLFFLLCLVVALAVTMPVQHLLAFAKPSKSVGLFGVDGTLFNGRVAEVTVNRFPLQNIEYRFDWACLAALKVCYRVDYVQGSIRAAYDLVNGDIEFDNSRLQYPAAEVAAQAQANLPVTPGGDLRLDIERLSMHNKRLVALSGRLVWRGLGVNDSNAQFDIGDYRVDFSGDGARYDFKFSDLDADLDVDGEASVGEDGMYALDLRLASEDSIEPQVKSLLELVAERSGVNKYRIEREGRVPNKIARQLFRN